MDMNEIRSRLSSLQQKPKKSTEKKENKSWKPSIGKQVIRILPSKFNSNGSPFTELFFYYKIGSKKTILSPLSFGEKDPIAEFVKQLRNANDKDSYFLSKKLEPKMRVFVPIIVRGEEDKGVRLWQFGKETYMELLSMADDEDIGDYTDINEGRDITVDTVGPDVTGTEYNKSTVRAKTKQTPIASSKEEIKKLLEDQPNPLDQYNKYSFDEIKSSLQEYLSPSDNENEEEEEQEESSTNNSKNPWEKTGASSVKSKPKKDFNKLFEEEN